MTVQMTATVDETTQQKFEKACENMGLSPSNVLNMFIKNVADHNAIPFPANPPHEKKAVRPPLKFGCLAGQIWMADDFDAPLDDFENGANSNIPVDSTDASEKKAVRPPFPFGCMAGQIWMADDFDAPLEDFKEYME